MRRAVQRRSNLIVALALFAANVFVASRIVSLSYSHFTWQAYAAIYGPGEGGLGVDSCSDHIDNDANGLIDCADPGCAGAPNCIALAPAMSWYNLLTLLVVLGTVGLLSLRRQRQQQS